MNLAKKIRMIRKLAESFEKQNWKAEYRASSFENNPTIDQVIDETFLGGYVIGPPQPGRGDLAAITTMYLSLLDPATVLAILNKLEEKS